MIGNFIIYIIIVVYMCIICIFVNILLCIVFINLCILKNNGLNYDV